jgi:NAD(P)-dependent dehydrogenase (short-subunit alcohol dehydrogenase family)
MAELDGRVALVTGGAGGFGGAICRRLAALGADVAVADVDVTSPASEAVQRDVRALGSRAIAIRADVTSDADCARMARDTIEQLGAIDILIANAGIGGEAALAWEVSEENWDRVVGISLKGTWLTTRHVVPHMIERGTGRIVMTSSRNGLRAERYCSAYIAAKHGIVGYMKALALELGPHRINVNAICPTSMGDQHEWHPWWDMVTGKEGATAAEYNAWSGSQDLFEKDHRMTFEAAAEAAVWLVTDGAATITGHALPIDDGWIVKRGG